MGEINDVDTTAFRRAIWNYIHCLYGIMHDDYNYDHNNLLLEKNLKAYIKTVTCYPERLNKKDYDSVMSEFKHSEKVRHFNFINYFLKILQLPHWSWCIKFSIIDIHFQDMYIIYFFYSKTFWTLNCVKRVTRKCWHISVTSFICNFRCMWTSCC